jgi:hypothetical protein
VDGQAEYEFPCFNRENFDGLWWNANDQVFKESDLLVYADLLVCAVLLKMSIFIAVHRYDKIFVVRPN